MAGEISKDDDTKDTPTWVEPSPRAWGTPYLRLMEAEANLRSLLPHTVRNNMVHSSLRRALENVSEVGEFLLREEAKLQQVRDAQEKEKLPMPDGRWLVSVREAAKLVGVSTSTIYTDYVHGEWGPFIVKLGSRIMVRLDGLREWLDMITKQQHPEPPENPFSRLYR